jgi:hypothetical protein
MSKKWQIRCIKPLITCVYKFIHIYIYRIIKSSAVFDMVKLRWINGQHLRAIPKTEIEFLVGQISIYIYICIYIYIYINVYKIYIHVYLWEQIYVYNDIYVYEYMFKCMINKKKRNSVRFRCTFKCIEIYF